MLRSWTRSTQNLPTEAAALGQVAKAPCWTLQEQSISEETVWPEEQAQGRAWAHWATPSPLCSLQVQRSPFERIATPFQVYSWTAPGRACHGLRAGRGCLHLPAGLRGAHSWTGARGHPRLLSPFPCGAQAGFSVPRAAQGGRGAGLPQVVGAQAELAYPSWSLDPGLERGAADHTGTASEELPERLLLRERAIFKVPAGPAGLTTASGLSCLPTGFLWIRGSWTRASR